MDLYQKLPEVFSAYSYAFFIGVITALLYRNLKDNPSIKRLADWAGLPFVILLFLNLPDLKLELGIASEEGAHPVYHALYGTPHTSSAHPTNSIFEYFHKPLKKNYSSSCFFFTGSFIYSKNSTLEASRCFTSSIIIPVLTNKPVLAPVATNVRSSGALGSSS